MQVYYFSRTGNSQRIAQEIASSHGLEALGISDGQNWQGGRNFLRAGAMSSKGETLPVQHEALVQNGEIVLVFPVWAGRIPPAIRGFLEEATTNQVTGVAVSAATGLKEGEMRPFSKVYQSRGKEPLAPVELLGDVPPAP